MGAYFHMIKGLEMREMVYKLNVSQLSEELRQGIDLLKEDYEISYDEEGCYLVGEVVSNGKLVVDFKDNKARISYHSLSSFYRGVGHVLQAMSSGKLSCHIEEVSSFESNGLMFDCSRNGVLNVKSIEGLLRKLALLGHNVFMLYMEDVYEIFEQPYFGYMRGRYTHEELRHIDDYAHTLGIEVIPCIQTLAHLNQFLRWPHTNQYKDMDDILLVGSDSVHELIEQMMRNLAQCFRSNKVHVGMDEAYNLGRGKYLDEHGYTPKLQIMQNHLKLVRSIAKTYGKEIIIWDDMFFRSYGTESEDSLVDLDEVNLMYWDYYHDSLDYYRHELTKRLALSSNTMFAGGAWKWIGYVPHHTKTLMTTCPALTACKELGIKHVMVTSWGDDGCEAPVYNCLFGTVLFAEYGYQSDFDLEVFKEKLAFITGLSYEEHLLIERIDLPADVSPTSVTNLSKYVLYQDPLSGICDYHLQNLDLTSHFKDILDGLESLKVSEEAIDYIQLYRSFVQVLELKWNLGLNIRKAYQENNCFKLECIIEHQIRPLLQRLDEFKWKYEMMWMRTLKPQGYEVIDIRLGGVKTRLETTLITLQRYLAGEISQIPLLEEELLPYYEGQEGLIILNQYGLIASASRLTW